MTMPLRFDKVENYKVYVERVLLLLQCIVYTDTYYIILYVVYE